MNMKTRVDKQPIWWDEEIPGAPVSILTVGTLCRNLAGFFFPIRMSDEDKVRLENTIKEKITSISELQVDDYINLSGVSPKEHLYLSERFLITYDLLSGIGNRGAFIGKDQRFSIMVNSSEHLTIRAIFAGNQVETTWRFLNQLDDIIGKHVDYMTDARLGFLTSDLNLLGTGLKIFVLLHLPGLARTGEIIFWENKLKSFGFYLRGIRTGQPLDYPSIPVPKHIVDQGIHSTIVNPVCTGLIETVGSLFVIGNLYTLGFSEQEIVLSLEQKVREATKAEYNAREKLLNSSKLTLEDMIGRAEGVVRGARFLEFAEAIEIWSALNLGLSLGLIKKDSPILDLSLIFEIQGGHILNKLNLDTNSLIDISISRAEKFRETYQKN